MLQDGIEDVENILDQERLEQREKMKQADITSDTIGTHYLKVENSTSFSDLAIYTVKLPVSEHGRPEVKEAKETEVENLLNYDVFEEVKDEGQDILGSRWVVTAKEKHDGQKKNTKARLVVCGFQENVKPEARNNMETQEAFIWLGQCFPEVFAPGKESNEADWTEGKEER